MPAYLFYCEHCEHHWELKMMFEDYVLPDRCPECSATGVFRDYFGEKVVVQEGTKTLGSLADKNHAKLSDDEKNHIKNKNKIEKTGSPLPDGMSRMS